MTACDTCQGAWRGSGPCPGCGELPAVELVGAGGSAPAIDDERRVTTPTSARRSVFAVVAFVVGLIVVSIVVDGGGGAEERGDADPSTTTTTVRNRRTTTTEAVRPPLDGDPITTVAVSGFDGMTLVVAETGGWMWQVPLDGGEVVPLGATSGLGGLEHLVDGTLVGYEGGISLRDGTTWRNFLSSGPGTWPIGLTGSGTLLTADDDTFRELGAGGEVLAEHPRPDLSAAEAYPGAVSGRFVLYHSAHGVARYDLDTGELWRVSTGSLVTALPTPHAVVTVCDDDLRCADEVISLVDGTTVAVLDQRVVSTVPDQAIYLPPVVSPDGTRMIVLAGGVLRALDLETGSVIGEIPIPDGLAELDASWWVSIKVVWEPSSRAVLVMMRQIGDPAHSDGGLYVVVADRDLRRVDQDPGLAEVLRIIVRIDREASFHVTPEHFAPFAPLGDLED